MDLVMVLTGQHNVEAYEKETAPVELFHYPVERFPKRMKNERQVACGGIQRELSRRRRCRVQKDEILFQLRGKLGEKKHPAIVSGQKRSETQRRGALQIL